MGNNITFTFTAGSESEAVSRLEACLEDVRLRMARNYRKPNESKTVFFILGSKRHMRNAKSTHITIGEEKVPASDSVNILKLFLQVT